MSTSPNSRKDGSNTSQERRLTISPKQIKFSQDTIKATFRNGTACNQALCKIAKENLNPEEFPRIQVVRKKQEYYSIDNRRLYVFRVLCRLGIIGDIDVTIIGQRKAKRRNFTTNCQGCHVKIRKNKQARNQPEVTVTFRHCNCSLPDVKDYPDWWDLSTFSVVLAPQAGEALENMQLSKAMGKGGWPALRETPSNKDLVAFLSGGKSSDEEEEEENQRMESFHLHSPVKDSTASPPIALAYHPFNQLVAPSAGSPYTFPSSTESDSERSVYSMGLRQESDYDNDLFLYRDSSSSKPRAYRRRRSSSSNGRRKWSFLRLSSKLVMVGAVCGLGCYLYQFYLKENYPDTVEWVWSNIDTFRDKLMIFYESVAKLGTEPRTLQVESVKDPSRSAFDIDVLLGFT